VLGFFHRCPGFFADAEIGEAGRNHDSFLRTADEDVDSPGVYIKVRCAESGNAVDNQKCFGYDFVNHFGDRLNVVANRSGSFGGLHVNRAMLGLEGRTDLSEVKRLAVRGSEHVGIAAKSFGKSGPALTKFSGGQDQDTVAGRGEV